MSASSSSGAKTKASTIPDQVKKRRRCEKEDYGSKKLNACVKDFEFGGKKFWRDLGGHQLGGLLSGQTARHFAYRILMDAPGMNKKLLGQACSKLDTMKDEDVLEEFGPWLGRHLPLRSS